MTRGNRNPEVADPVVRGRGDLGTGREACRNERSTAGGGG